MFDIAFVPDEAPHINEDGWRGFWAAVVFGTFRERFVAPVGVWQRADYEKQWLSAAQRLVDGHSESAFVAEAGRLWWTAWVEGTDIFIQQRLLVDEAMAPAWVATVANMPYHLVGPRETHSDSGDILSQWAVTLEDLRFFIDRRSNTAAV